jgi:hypothetical protein
MIVMLGEAQVPFLASVLLLAAAAKLVLPDGGTGVPGSPHWRRSFAYALSGVEGVLGIALLFTGHHAVRLAAVVFFATATSIVAELMRRGSEEGCGCFGNLSTAPAGRRTVLRVALLTVAAIGSAGVHRTGLQIINTAGTLPVLVFAVETALLLALSPEVVVAVERIRSSIPCELRDVPLEETYETLHASDAWRDHEERLTSPQPVEVWRELCRRYLVYPAAVDGRPAEVVFAVPIGGRPPDVRAGLVEGSALEQDDDSGPQRVASPA